MQLVTRQCDHVLFQLAVALGYLLVVEIVGIDGLLQLEQDVLFPVPLQAVDDLFFRGLNAEIHGVRTVWRLRDQHIKDAGRCIQHMQKALIEMNVQLHIAISDLSGVTGQAIIRALLSGQRDPRKLAALRHWRKERRELERRLNSADPGLEIINPHAAGIDVGNESHYVAVPPGRDARPVREFGSWTAALEEMAQWLKSCGIETVVLQSTGVYWIAVHDVLQSHGLEVNLVDARGTKSVPGRKSDVQECQWLLKLHTYGLVRSCFLPAPVPVQLSIA